MRNSVLLSFYSSFDPVRYTVVGVMYDLFLGTGKHTVYMHLQGLVRFTHVGILT